MPPALDKEHLLHCGKFPLIPSYPGPPFRFLSPWASLTSLGTAVESECVLLPGETEWLWDPGCVRASQVAQCQRTRLPVQETQEMWVRSLEKTLEKEVATHSRILAWKIPWTEEPGGLSPWGHKELDMTEHAHTHTHTRMGILKLLSFLFSFSTALLKYHS